MEIITYFEGLMVIETFDDDAWFLSDDLDSSYYEFCEE
jgi:hypothetical protein